MAEKKEKTKQYVLPVIPLRNMVVFPQMIVPLFIGRPRSISALEEALKFERKVLVSLQKDEDQEDPEPKGINAIGTISEVVQMLKLPDGTTKVLIEGLGRARILDFTQTEPFYAAQIEEIEEITGDSVKTQALTRLVAERFEEYVRLNQRLPAETLLSVVNYDEPGRLADLIVSYLPLKAVDKQSILEAVSLLDRLEKLDGFLSKEVEVLEVEKKLHGRVKEQIDKVQKEYYLREKMRAIQQELGTFEEENPEVQEYKKKIAEAKMPPEAKKQALAELGRMAKTPALSAESGVIRNYLDWLVDLPWSKKTRTRIDIKRVAKILDEDHYGLNKVKERILEYYSVFALTKKIQGSIICFLGPAGVGKTSVARSIARAMKRKFVRVSLGGMRDEAELRGHRRTYVGSLPGRVIQQIKKAGTSNPVFLLDEVDKIGTDFHGDPAAALLEILDPEQNNSFSDHYLEVPFDLSDVMFITTANTTHNIPRPLLDRMEVISLPGYTEEEKMGIAVGYLIPKEMKRHGLDSSSLKFSEDSLRQIIRCYTREAGVREVERTIAAICRKVARGKVEGCKRRIKVTSRGLHRFLGASKFHYGMKEEADQIGVTTGLVWTEAGGDTVPIEVTVVRGKGELTLTGQLGEVMQESARAALSYIRSRAQQLKLDENFYRHIDIHIHVPEGAIPKDGPSAGITIATAIASALGKLPVDREVAMTGEITLRGRVLPIGGLKEKALAAHRAGIKTIIIPDDNKPDLEEIPSKIKRQLKIITVKHMDEVLSRVLRGFDKMSDHQEETAPK